jgi:hypothetical protein
VLNENLLFSIAGTIFANQLRSQLPIYAANISASEADAVRQSVTAIFTLPKADQAGVIEAYCRALGYVFILGIPAGAFGSLSGM